MNSSVFLAERPVAFTDSTDNNFSPINLGTDTVDKASNISTTSVFGLLTRKAFYREGLGSVLIDANFDTSIQVNVPKRSISDNTSPFPFGNAAQKHTLFNSVDYSKLNTTVANLFNNNTKTRAVVVIHKNQIIETKKLCKYTIFSTDFFRLMCYYIKV